MTNKQQKNLLCVDDLRHAEYYQMQTTFDDLYLAVSTLIQSPIFSVGIGLASIVPSVLMINTKIWFAYPMSYPFYLIMVAYGRAAEGVYETQIAWLPWLPVAVGITILALVVSCMRYGASERR